jgi:sterol 3beta-glucosyltransferase
MRIAIVCNDTRGGVQPYVALASGLLDAGHLVQAVAPGDLAAMFTDVGIAVTPLSGQMQALLRASGGVTERGTVASMLFAARQLPRVMETWMRETLAGCQGADLVTGGIGAGTGLEVAEALGVPFIETHLQPVGVPTDAYPPVLMPTIPRALGPAAWRLAHRLSEAALFGSVAGPTRRARRRVLGLRRRSRAADGRAVLYGFSPHVVRVPSVGLRPRYTTGYWTLHTPGGWSPPAALAAFLAVDGPPVVAIGFGSMGSGDPVALTELVRGAVRDAGVRGVLIAGWGGLTSTGDDPDVLTIDAVPHDWLFPRVAAVVHHGGAGTTGASLRAGTPTVVVPFAMDQPFWGGRVAALGAGPTPIPRARLSRARLADAMRLTVRDASMRARAADLGRRIRGEDGVGEAVRLLVAG